MNQKSNLEEKNKLLQLINEDTIQIINLGLDKFAKTYQENGIKVLQVDWKPPAEIEDDLSNILSMLG